MKNNQRAFRILCFWIFVCVFVPYIVVIPVTAYFVAATTDKNQYHTLQGKIISVRDSAPQLQLETDDRHLVWIELPVSEFAHGQRSYVLKPEVVKNLLNQKLVISGYEIPRQWSISFRAMEITQDRIVMSDEEAKKYLKANRGEYFALAKLMLLIAACFYLYRYSFKGKI